MAKQEAISFMQFKKKFDSEAACRDHLFPSAMRALGITDQIS